MGDPAKARREVGLFLALTLATSGVFYAYLIFAREAPHPWGSRQSFLFMWCPGISAIATRLILHRNVRGIGWGPGKAKHYLLAFFLPLAFCLPVYLLAWVSGLGALDLDRLLAAEARFGMPQSPAGHAGMVLLALIGVPLSMASALGEELGWRGLLVPRLSEITSYSRTSLVTGIVWAAWHYPLMFVLIPRFLPGLPLPYATLCFTLSVVGISFVYTWIRLESGSVWPLALLHGASNVFQESFQGITRDTGYTWYVTFEYGAGFTVVIALLAFLFWRKRDALPGPRTS